MDSRLLQLYRQLSLLRQFELKAQELYRRGSIPGFIHLYVGEEAVAVGVCSHLQNDDYITSTHRGHGHALAKGVPPREVMAELWGRQTGCSRGRGGSMHLYDPENGLLGTNGLVGAGIPIAAGAALAAKLAGTSRVAVSFFGDGAVNHGAFHEGANLAAAWNLPVVLVCENNLYATETPFRVATRNQDVSSRAQAYGMQGVAVDGNDVQEVFAAAGEAIDQARRGGGPTLIECRTYRILGHHEGDPGTGYRTKEEVEKWRERCPISRLKTQILTLNVADEIALREIEAEVEGVIADAIEFADSSPWPAAADLPRAVFPETLELAG